MASSGELVDNGDGTWTLSMTAQDVTIIAMEETANMPGDLNGDGNVDVEDMNIMINVVLDMVNTNQLSGDPDLDGNGIVDVVDVNTLINLVLN